jgi:hypothetical protein
MNIYITHARSARRYLHTADSACGLSRFLMPLAACRPRCFCFRAAVINYTITAEILQKSDAKSLRVAVCTVCIHETPGCELTRNNPRFNELVFEWQTLKSRLTNTRSHVSRRTDEIRQFTPFDRKYKLNVFATKKE